MQKLQHDKGNLCIKPTANEEKFKAYPLKPRQGYPLLPSLFDIVFQIITIRQLKKIKITQIGKKEAKISLFEDNIL